MAAEEILKGLWRVMCGLLSRLHQKRLRTLVCVLIEAAGLALIWLAPWAMLVFVWVTLTGFGYSLVYPGFGVEAVRHAPPESRGLAMGAYTAFLDLSLGLTAPTLGLVASGAGLGAVFLVSTLVVMCSAAIAVRLIKRRWAPDGAVLRSNLEV